MWLLAAMPLLLLTASAAGAAELESSVAFRTSFDSNQREVSDRFNKQSGYAASINPVIELRGAQERLRYNVSYRPSLFYVSEADPHDRLNHRAAGALSYELGRRTVLGVSFDYDNTQTLLRDRDEAPGVESDLVFERERRQSISASLDLSHRWSRYLSTSLTATQSIFLADTERLADAFGTSLSAAINYRLGEDATAGLTASVRRQQFQETDFRESASTRSASIQAVWSQKLDERTTLSLRAGPLLVDPEEQDPLEPLQTTRPLFPTDIDDKGNVFLFDVTSCEPADTSGFLLVPGQCDIIDQAVTDEDAEALLASAPDVPEGLTPVEWLQTVRTRAFLLESQIPEVESEQQLTFSASLSLVRRWRRTTASLRFSRSEGSVDSLGTSTVRNVIDASLEWAPTPDWNIRLWGDWTERETTSDVQQRVSVVRSATDGVGEFARAAQATALLAVFTDSNVADATIYSASFSAWRRLTEHWYVGAIVRYQNQERENDFFVTQRDFENVGITFALRYRFPDFKPW